MKAGEFIGRLEAAHRRFHVVGNADWGVVVALDLEGRCFAALDGEVANRINVAAVEKASLDGAYACPGGDGLWPAPEGSTRGYQYATGAWRVPPSIVNARHEVCQQGGDWAVVRAEADLVNAAGLGVPVLLERRISAVRTGRRLSVRVLESVEYRGWRVLTSGQCRLAPWTLCQFDCGEGAEAVFPDAGPGCVWDLYGPSDGERRRESGLLRVRTDNGKRFQLGLCAEVPWIEFRDPRRGLRVRRTAEPLARGLGYIDIADRPPTDPPDPRGVRYSVYSDASGFMEIEAAGGMPPVLERGRRLELAVCTEYEHG
jgi:hypothetical protein